jgi:hypothetical protein
MATNIYCLAKQTLTRLKKSGKAVCPICNQPFLEGQDVISVGHKVRHEECFKERFI